MTEKTALQKEIFKNTIGKWFLSNSRMISIFLNTMNRYNEPEKLIQKDVNKSDSPAKDTKLSYLQNYLASMKSGTKVFTQHLLASTNLSKMLEGVYLLVFKSLKK